MSSVSNRMCDLYLKINASQTIKRLPETGVKDQNILQTAKDVQYTNI